MTPTAFTWPYWPLFAATIIWAYVPEFKIVRAARTAVRGAGSRDAGSFQMIVYAGGAASAIAVATGAYRILRHPSYAAGLLMNVGFGLALGNWASLALVALGAFAVYSYRIAVEERALLTVVGAPYREFMATRRRLIPFIY